MTVTDDNECNDSDSMTVSFSGIEVNKTASLTGSCPGSDPLAVSIGDTVTYCFNVANTGDVTLTGVSVSDDIYGPVTNLDKATLAPGESAHGTITHVVVEGDAPSVTDTATATGTDPLGGTVTDSDPCTINVAIAPGIEVVKTSSPTEGAPCTDVTFIIEVTNTGDCELNPVIVVDTLPAGMSYVSDDFGGSVSGQQITWATSLGVGASQTIHLVAHIDTGASGTLTDSVTAIGTPPDGDDVSDTDTATVKVYAPGISVNKVANPIAGPPSTDVTFTITATNAGDCLLDPVMVVDTLPAGMSYVSSSPVADSHDGTITWNNVGPLASGASKTVTLVAHIDEGAAGMLENVVCVTGTPPAGADVHDCDTVEIEVLAKTIVPPEKTLIDITTEIKSDGIVIEGEQFRWEAGNGNLLNNPPLAPGEAVGGIKYNEKMISSNGTTKYTKNFSVNTHVTPNLAVKKDIGYKSGYSGSLSHAEQVGMRYTGASPPLSSNTKCEEAEAYSDMVVTNVSATTEIEVGITETDERNLLYEIDAEGNGTVSAGVDVSVEDGSSADAPASRWKYKDKSIGYGNFTFNKKIGYRSNPP